MKPEQAKALREAFPDRMIGRLPKGGVMLSYVGHAATTARLLSVDPGWTWEPVAFDERGLPRLDEHGGLWIRLTVCDVSKLGYGDAGGKKGPNAIKEAIGDAIRNAAMRFGVAIDLWAKEDLTAASGPAPVESSELLLRAAKARVWQAAKTRGIATADDLAIDYAATHDGQTLDSATVEELTAYAETLEQVAA